MGTVSRLEIERYIVGRLHVNAFGCKREDRDISAYYGLAAREEKCQVGCMYPALCVCPHGKVAHGVPDTGRNRPDTGRNGLRASFVELPASAL